MLLTVCFRTDRREEENVEPLRVGEEAEAGEAGAHPVEGAGPRDGEDLVVADEVLRLRRRSVGLSERGDGDGGIRHCDGVVVEDGWGCSGSGGGHSVRSGKKNSYC